MRDDATKLWAEQRNRRRRRIDIAAMLLPLVGSGGFAVVAGTHTWVAATRTIADMPELKTEIVLVLVLAAAVCSSVRLLAVVTGVDRARGYMAQEVSCNDERNTGNANRTLQE